MTNRKVSESRSVYWRQQVTAWQSSGQSRKLFCEKQDLSYHRFGYWQRKLQGSNQVSEHQALPGFIPVSLSQQPQPNDLSLVLPSGLVLQGIDNHNLPIVFQLLTRLS